MTLVFFFTQGEEPLVRYRLARALPPTHNHRSQSTIFRPPTREDCGGHVSGVGRWTLSPSGSQSFLFGLKAMPCLKRELAPRYPPSPRSPSSTVCRSEAHRHSTSEVAVLKASSTPSKFDAHGTSR